MEVSVTDVSIVPSVTCTRKTNVNSPKNGSDNAVCGQIILCLLSQLRQFGYWYANICQKQTISLVPSVSVH